MSDRGMDIVSMLGISETCSLGITLMLSIWMYDLCGNLYLDRVKSKLRSTRFYCPLRHAV
jgi:hypothetical protein